MKKLFFLTSHLCSGSSFLMSSLNLHPRIEVFETGLRYTHPNDLDRNLLNKRHKLDNVAAVYGDHHLFNISIAWKGFYEFCKFIYLVRDASCIREIAAMDGYDAESACRYYCYRLRRISEMANDTPNAMFLTMQDIYKPEAMELIRGYLDVKVPIELPAEYKKQKEVDVPLNILEQAQDSYERHLFYLKQQELRKI